MAKKNFGYPGLMLLFLCVARTALTQHYYTVVHLSDPASKEMREIEIDRDRGKETVRRSKNWEGALPSDWKSALQGLPQLPLQCVAETVVAGHEVCWIEGDFLHQILPLSDEETQTNQILIQNGLDRVTVKGAGEEFHDAEDTLLVRKWIVDIEAAPKGHWRLEWAEGKIE